MDKDLAKVLRDFSELIKNKNENLQGSMDIDTIDLNEIILYNNERLNSLGLYLNIQGYHNVELKEGSLDQILNAYNINEYVRLTFNAFCGEGIQELADEFTKSFNSVFHINNLKCFSSLEIEELLSGNSENDWSSDTLTEYIVPNHGYNKFR